MTSRQDKLKEIKENLSSKEKGAGNLLGNTLQEIWKGEDDKIEKTGSKSTSHKKGFYKPNGKSGGKRTGSGRKPLEEDEKRMSNKKAWENFAEEEVEVTELHKGTREIRKLKMKRLRVAQEKLFKKVQEGDVPAIREFNDRVGGKARQPLVGDHEEDPIEIDIGVDRILDKVYGEEDDE